MEQFITSPLFQALFNSPVPRIIVMADAPAFTILVSNDAHKSVTNLVGRDISGRSIWDIFDPNESGGDGGVLLKEALTSAQMTNKTVLMPAFRYDMGAPDGNGMVEKWWQLEIMPVGGDQNAPKYLLTTTNDITDLVWGEKEKENVQRELEHLVEDRTGKLTASELKYRTLIEQSPLGIALLLGRDMIIDAVNPQMLKLWAKSEDTAIKRLNLNHLSGKKLTDILPEVAVQHISVLDTVFESGVGVRYNEVSYPLSEPGQSGEQYASIFFDPVFNQTGQVSGAIVSAIDVTEQVGARKELERAYEQVSLSKQAAQLGTFDMDLKKGIMEWDSRCRELFGIHHSAEVTYEKDFLIGLHPDDRERVQSVIDRLFNKELSDGIYDVEYRTIGADDRKVRWIRAKGKVYFDNGNKPVRFIGSVLEITEQKHEEQLRNDFIAMASHELKTPLTSLMAYVQVIQQHTLTGDESELLKQAEKQVVKMVKMIDGFLNLSRLESGKFNLRQSPVSMNALIDEVVADIKLTNPGVAIHIMPCRDVVVLADQDKMEHVMINLLTNAVKYSGPQKPINIKCSTDDNFVIVSISDEGIGIKKTDLERLFDRYYRVEHPDAKYVSGFGIGLYLSQEIIQMHGGKIWVESEPGKGSTFSFRIPFQ